MIIDLKKPLKCCVILVDILGMRVGVAGGNGALWIESKLLAIYLTAGRLRYTLLNSYVCVFNVFD